MTETKTEVYTGNGSHVIPGPCLLQRTRIVGVATLLLRDGTNNVLRCATTDKSPIDNNRMGIRIGTHLGVEITYAAPDAIVEITVATITTGADECTGCGRRFDATPADKLPICSFCKRRQEEPMTETKTECKGTIVGTCIVCTREIAARETKTGVRPDGMHEVPRWFGGAKPSHRLVHHGYHRPGYGYIIGDCFAVKMPPHELSPYAAEAYRSFCAKMKLEAEGYLRRLESGEVKELHRQEILPVPTTGVRPYAFHKLGSNDDPGWREVAVPYYSTELYGTARCHVWEGLHADEVAGQKSRIRSFGEEVQRMTGAIKDWKPADLRERAEPVPDPSKRRRRSRRRF